MVTSPGGEHHNQRDLQRQSEHSKGEAGGPREVLGSRTARGSWGPNESRTRRHAPATLVLRTVVSKASCVDRSVYGVAADASIVANLQVASLEVYSQE